MRSKSSGTDRSSAFDEASRRARDRPYAQRYDARIDGYVRGFADADLSRCTILLRRAFAPIRLPVSVSGSVQPLRTLLETGQLLAGHGRGKADRRAVAAPAIFGMDTHRLDAAGQLPVD
jgi:hypothetical protein